MNSLLQCKPTIPPPDGGYPGFNTAEGQNALFSLTTGAGKTAVGWLVLALVRDRRQLQYRYRRGSAPVNTEEQNTAFGAAALLFNSTGYSNTAVGTSALLSNNTGPINTATGWSALRNNTSGLNNRAVGALSGSNQTTGSSKVYIGGNVYGVAGENNTIHIADNLPTGGGQSACYIGGIAGQTVGAGGAACYVDNAGKLGVFLSARRYKENSPDAQGQRGALRSKACHLSV